jgi:hypothetical protein
MCRVSSVSCHSASGNDGQATSLVVSAVALVTSGRPRFSIGIDATCVGILQRPGCGLHVNAVYITPSPVFSRLEAPDYGVSRLMEVLCRMLVQRVIAAADVAAGKTKTKVNPLAAHFKTLFTSVRRAGTDIANFSQMSAVAGHCSSGWRLSNPDNSGDCTAYISRAHAREHARRNHSSGSID